MNRTKRTSLAQETVKVVEQGSYLSPDGRRIDIASPVKSCLLATQFYSPQQLEDLRNRIVAEEIEGPEAIIEVRNETTLDGIFRLLAETDGPVAALNFASAKNPGGGFLNGSQAQEESLARSSALYASLLRAPQYYEGHPASRSCLYSDAIILSPNCPIFRDDKGSLLEQPLAATFITSAAPNAGAIVSNSPEDLPLIEPTFHRRAEYVFALAAAQKCRKLVLGAWGCGVFRNDPRLVAEAFARHIGKGGSWSQRFQRIVFSIFDNTPSQQTLEAFHQVFGTT
jgi:uncharacterized protein (TIGR02452 family)